MYLSPTSLRQFHKQPPFVFASHTMSSFTRSWIHTSTLRTSVALVWRLYMEYLLLCPPIGRPLGTETILVVYYEASVIGDMFCDLMVPSSWWEGSLESPFHVSSSSNSKFDPTGNGKKKFYLAPDSAMLDIPPDTLRTSALFQRITKPTHWPSHSPTIYPVHMDSSKTRTTWTTTSNGTTSLHSTPSRTWCYLEGLLFQQYYPLALGVLLCLFPAILYFSGLIPLHPEIIWYDCLVLIALWHFHIYWWVRLLQPHDCQMLYYPFLTWLLQFRASTRVRPYKHTKLLNPFKTNIAHFCKPFHQ